jgi:hypothetical protein
MRWFTCQVVPARDCQPAAEMCCRTHCTSSTSGNHNYYPAAGSALLLGPTPVDVPLLLSMLASDLLLLAAGVFFTSNDPLLVSIYVTYASCRQCSWVAWMGRSV